MLILLENETTDLELLTNALVERQIDKDSINAFRTIEAAESFMSTIDRRLAAPIAIIADVGLGDDYRNGANFIQDQYNRFRTETGSGIWTFLISVKDLTKGLGLTDPVPHFTFEKSSGWFLRCAEVASSLCLNSLPFDKENDLAPPESLEVRSADRIYLFSSGEARHLHLQDDGNRTSLLKIQEPPVYYQDEINPILMYRGLYLVLDHHHKDDVKPHLTRALLRWRRAALGPSYGDDGNFQRSISVKQVCSWSPDPDGLDAVILDEERGLRLRSVHNVVNTFRNNRQANKLCNFLFNSSDGKWLPAFPNPPKKFPNRNQKVPFSETELNRYKQLPFPVPVRGGKLADCFMTRLHFVLSDEEVENYQDWKREWQERFRDKRSPQPALSG